MNIQHSSKSTSLTEPWFHQKISKGIIVSNVSWFYFWFPPPNRESCKWKWYARFSLLWKTIQTSDWNGKIILLIKSHDKQGKTLNQLVVDRKMRLRWRINLQGFENVLRSYSSFVLSIADFIWFRWHKIDKLCHHNIEKKGSLIGVHWKAMNELNLFMWKKFNKGNSYKASICIKIFDKIRGICKFTMHQAKKQHNDITP